MTHSRMFGGKTKRTRKPKNNKRTGGLPAHGLGKAHKKKVLNNNKIISGMRK